MKALKKLSCLLLAVLLLMSVSVTAFAAEGAPTVKGPDASFALTINESDPNHSYTAYQIFKGSLTQQDGNEILTDIQWGDGVSEAGKIALVDAFKAVSTSAADVAKAIGSTAADAQKVAEIMAVADNQEGAGITIPRNGEGNNYSTTVTTGYYVVYDSVTDGDAYTAASEYIVQVVGATDVTPKADKPSVEKEVQEESRLADGKEGWGDDADYDIGDDVPFRLTATLGTHYGDYTTYKLVFHDTPSKGLTVNEDSFTVTVDGTTTLGADQFKVVVATDGSFTVTIEDLKEVAPDAHDNSVIVVQYTAELNNNAEILTANPNEVYLEYSNEPHSDGTGRTPKDEVNVFTYKIDVFKYDGKDKVGEELPEKGLEGVEFVLSRGVGENVEYVSGVDDNDKITGWTKSLDDAMKFLTDEQGKISVKGLDDGTYTLTETKPLPGYNTAEPIEITVEGTNVTTTGDLSDAAGVVNVENNEGLELPETGGIGTTIFYAVGGVLVVAALVLLVTKKRMSKES